MRLHVVRRWMRRELRGQNHLIAARRGLADLPHQPAAIRAVQGQRRQHAWRGDCTSPIIESRFGGGPGKLQPERSDFSAYGFAIGTGEDRVLAWLSLVPTRDLAVRGAGRGRHPSQHAEPQQGTHNRSHDHSPSSHRLRLGGSHVRTKMSVSQLLSFHWYCAQALANRTRAEFPAQQIAITATRRNGQNFNPGLYAQLEERRVSAHRCLSSLSHS
jgi:hypothetical protein